MGGSCMPYEPQLFDNRVVPKGKCWNPSLIIN